MRRQDLKAYAARASQEFIEKYREENQQRPGRQLVSDGAYLELKKEIENRILLVASRTRKIRRR